MKDSIVMFIFCCFWPEGFFEGVGGAGGIYSTKIKIVFEILNLD